jgi:transposase InsO family protein
MKFQFIERHQQAHSVELMARIFGVSRSGYYAWKSRPTCERSVMDQRLVEEIRAIQEECKYVYGSPRASEELRRRGYRVGENRVARLMRESKLGRRAKKRFRSTTDSTHHHAVAENLVQREFTVAAPNVVWASDLSYVSTAEGWLYLCVILDLFSRKVIGWAMGRRMTAGLMIQALIMACMHRRPPEGAIFHSDRGSQYCSDEFRGYLGLYRMRQSMSGVGDPWDNAPVESFFKTLKSELCGDRAFGTRAEARTAIFEYLEVFYNRKRLHSTLGYQTPEEYEQDFARRTA